MFCSTEVNIRADASLDLPDSVLEKLDIVVASIHSSFTQGIEQTTARYLKAIENPHVDIIAHPTGRILGRRDELQVDWPKVFEACVKTQTVLEINSGIDRLDLPDRLAREAAKAGVTIIISTDAHSPDGLANMRFGVAQAQRAGLTKRQILNTLKRDEFIAWFKR